MTSVIAFQWSTPTFAVERDKWGDKGEDVVIKAETRDGNAQWCMSADAARALLATLQVAMASEEMLAECDGVTA